MACKSCCKNKRHVTKGRWTREEDIKLRSHITKHGVICWRMVPSLAGLNRCGKSCRLRWLNYLRPGVRTHDFTSSEIAIILDMQSKLGNKWSEIAKKLAGRTDNHVKNFWNSYLKKPRQQAAISNSGHQHATRQLLLQQHPSALLIVDSHGSNAAAEAHVMLFHKDASARNIEEIPGLVESCFENVDPLLEEEKQWSCQWMNDSLQSCFWDYSSDINVPLLP